MLLSLLPYLIHSTTGGALPAVVAGVVVAFLLLTLLIAGIFAGIIAGIIGVVMLGRAKRRRNREKKRKLLEIIQSAEKREELLEGSVAKIGEYSIDNDSKRSIDDEVALHYERVQHEEEAHYESVDVPQQGSHGRVDSKGIRSKADYYNVVEAAENISSKKELGHVLRDMGQQDDQPKGTPNVVYAVVDKSKKKRQEETQGGASATTTQGVNTGEQHYEWSSLFGQNWLEIVVGKRSEESHGDVEQGSPSNDAKGTGPYLCALQPKCSICNGRQEQESEQREYK